RETMFYFYNVLLLNRATNSHKNREYYQYWPPQSAAMDYVDHSSTSRAIRLRTVKEVRSQPQMPRRIKLKTTTSKRMLRDLIFSSTSNIQNLTKALLQQLQRFSTIYIVKKSVQSQ